VGTESVKLLTMTEAATILRIQGKDRADLAWRRLRRLAKTTGVELLVDAGGEGWYTTRERLEEAIPALRSPAVSGKNLTMAVSNLQKEVDSLKEWRASLS
jgi:hypothetical protein